MYSEASRRRSCVRPSSVKKPKLLEVVLAARVLAQPLDRPGRERVGDAGRARAGRRLRRAATARSAHSELLARPSSSPPNPVTTAPPAADSMIGTWKWRLNGQIRPCRRSKRRRHGTDGVELVGELEAAMLGHAGDFQVEHALLPGMLVGRLARRGRRAWRGPDRSRPSRRATWTASASSADESRPPEKETRQGGRRGAYAMTASSAARGARSRRRGSDRAWRSRPSGMP